MSKLVLGLDVGISSVGWGILNLETKEVIDAGVRLFPEGNSNENVKRREFRSIRRLIRRRSHRIYRMKDLLTKYKIIDENFENLPNPYEIRAKGLTTKLTNEELATAILHITKRRGITGIVSVDELSSEEGLSTKETLGRNKKDLKDKYVCQVQLERLKEGKVRNHLNKFDVEDYEKELRQIFKNQSLSENLQEEIIDIIKSKREYYDGPGSEKSPTPYGQWYENDEGEIVFTSMIDKMRGRCSIYPDELCAPKMSYSACLFNMLNDLNNMNVNGTPISKEQKEEVIEKIINKGDNLTEVRLAKVIGVQFEEIFGWRKTKSGKPDFTKFEGYNLIKNLVDSNNMDVNIYLNKETVDKIANILTSYKGFNERVEHLIKLGLSNSEAEKLAELTKFSGYHSLSFKVIKEVLPDLWETNNNQIQIFQLNGYFEYKKQEYKGSKIPFDEGAILSAVARRAQREALRIVEAVIKEYGNLESIIIEMPRDKNSQEEKKRINKSQEKFEKINKQIDELLKGKKVNNKTKTKIRLWQQQDGKCAYSLQCIDFNNLIYDEYGYEIDHIIPISISFDDSLNNKVLVLNSENQKKGQKTPFQYFKSGESNVSYDEYKAFVLNNKNFSSNKRRYLLFEKDINSLDVKKGFINRNLVDTQYASRVILNTLQNYFKANGLETKVHTVRGASTSVFRKLSQIDKDRNEDFRHHAVDALIVAGIKTMKLFDNLLNVSLIKDSVISKETGELITLENENDFYDSEFIKYIKKLRNLEVKYSHKIDTKINRSMTDRTIFGTRIIDGERRLIRKINIYDEKQGQEFANKIRANKESELDKFFIYQQYKSGKDANFELLKKVVEMFPGDNNPFLEYYNQENDYIRKKSKKGRGPIIRYLKYNDTALGYHNPIGHKYNQEKEKVVLLQQNPFRVDVYLDNGQYKFLKINQNQLKLEDKKWIIPKEFYNQEKKIRKISDEAIFQFSLHKSDLFYYEKGNKKEVVRYIGTNYGKNRIEYKPMNRTDDERYHLTVGRQLSKLEKRSTNILGKVYIVKNESCKLEL